MKNQARFIKEIMDSKLVVSRKKKQIIVEELREQKYEAFPRGQDKKTKSEDDEEGNDEGNDDVETDTAANGYDYLLSVSLRNRYVLSAVANSS